MLDACDEPRVPEKVKELGEERALSLYRGSAEGDYWAIAPYLVQIDEALLDWIVANLWQDPWGIFASASVPLGELRKHFRRFLLVKDAEAKELYFRFYDPRVLPVYLAACTPSEAEHFFGPVKGFCVTRAEGRLLSIERNAGAAYAR